MSSQNESDFSFMLPTTRHSAMLHKTKKVRKTQSSNRVVNGGTKMMKEIESKFVTAAATPSKKLTSGTSEAVWKFSILHKIK